MIDINKYTQPLPVYQAGNGVAFDLLDLKVSLLYHGIHVDEEVYSAFEGKARMSKSPFFCSSMILDGQVSCLLSPTKQATPFRLKLQDGKPVITHNDHYVTEIAFHEKTSYHEQKTSGGIPYHYIAVIQGWDALTFACMWRCEITQSGDACAFCHTGSYAPPEHSLSDMMDIIRYAMQISPGTTILKMTAGSTFNPEGEIDRYVKILNAVDKNFGIENVPTVIYLTPPSDVRQLDRLFEAGAGWVACDLDIWDEKLFEKICPGKARINTRQRYMDSLYYIADKYGPSRACCVFVAGIEPAESLLEGETVLAERGIVSWPSPLMPFAVEQKVLDGKQPFSVDYFRTVRKETAKLYKKYELAVPASSGSDTCLHSDIWLRRDILAAGK